MSFKNRRELLFVYSVKDANPNGDPLNANQPRMDEQTNQILVSDVRIKRTIRDQWMRDGLEVFVDAEPKNLPERVNELKDKYNKSSEEAEETEEALNKCIDVRVFGVTVSLKKNAFSWTGPLQFKWGRSLHQAQVELVQGTGAFTTKEGATKEDATKEDATKKVAKQRTFRNEYLVPFVVLGVYGIANQYSSDITGATDEDLDKTKDALWQGTINLITRSKVGHVPRLLLEIIYQEGFQGMIGALDEKVALLKNGAPLSDEEQLSLRSLDGVQLSILPIIERLNHNSLASQVKKLRCIKDKDLQLVGSDKLRQMLGPNFELEER